MSIYIKTTLLEVLPKIDRDTDLAIDTETVGLYGKIRTVQFYQRHWEKVLLVEWPNAYELLQLLMSVNNTNLIAHKAAYDVSTIQQQTCTNWQPDRLDDTLLLARLALPSLDSYALDDLVTECVGRDVYADNGIVKSEMHKNNWGKLVLTEKDLTYASLDVLYLLEVYDKVKTAKESLSYKVDKRALRRALHFQLNGMAVSQKLVLDRAKTNLLEIDQLGCPINVNSWKQVRPYIGSEMSDDIGLATLSMRGNEKAAVVRQTRKLIKQNSFLAKYTSDEGRIYGRFGPYARSGRFTCSDQNLQQIPRALKTCFEAPEGKVLIYADYPQLELRTIAAITNDQTLCRAFYHALDPHGIVADQMFGSSFTKDQRQTTKTVNFNALYAGGVRMLQMILLKQASQWHEEADVARYLRKWKCMFNGIVAWQEQGIKAYRRGELKATPFGRQYKGRLLTDHLNIENQGFGADVAKLAMHYMYDDVTAEGGDMVNFIHDSYIIEADDDEAVYKNIAKRVAECMKEAWYEASKMTNVTDIPMPATVLVGYNWGDIETGKAIYKLEL